jgi:hypothetical protein
MEHLNTKFDNFRGQNCDKQSFFFSTVVIQGLKKIMNGLKNK